MTDLAKSSRTICPDCGLKLPQNAPAGLCPACLLRAAMFVSDDPQTDAGDVDSATSIALTLRVGIHVPGVCETSISPSEYHADDYPGVGSTLRYFGDYELHEEIARGGMGVVYRARQVRLNRQVALKMIRAGRFSSGTEIQRLRVEAEAAAQLDHPAIVPVFEVGEHEGLHYFTMAFVHGEPLSAKLIDGPLPVRVAVRLMQIVAEAVAFAHKKGVIHRDIKPGNILIDQAGFPRVSDFGLAKQIARDSELTTTGQILGTPSFMPPEQAEGHLDQVGPASDIYSLGAVLYSTLTGRPPFQAATSVETLRQVVDQPPVPPRRLNPSIPRDIETICLKCLDKDPSSRYSTASALALDLKCFLEGRPITARPVSRLERGWRWACRRPDLSLAILALVVLISLGLIAATIQQQRHLQSEQRVRVEGLVQTIRTADFRQLPELINDLKSFSDRSMVLQELAKQTATSESQKNRLRIDLAAAVLSGSLKQEAIEQWWFLSLQELLAIREMTRELIPQCRESLEEIVAIDSQDSSMKLKQLRATALLLGQSPARSAALIKGSEIPALEEGDESGGADWATTAGTLLRLLYEDPKEFDAALKLFQPAAVELYRPLRRSVETRTVSEQQRHLALALMSELLRESPWAIADLACMIGSEDLSLLQRHVDRMASRLLPSLHAELQRPEIIVDLSGELQPVESQKKMATALVEKRAQDVRRRAMAAAWLFRLGDVDAIWPLLKHQADDSLRYAVIDRIQLVGGAIDPVLAQIESAIRSPLQGSSESKSEKDSQLSMLLLLVGELAGQTRDETRNKAVSLLCDLFEHHPDPGIHSACEWSLRQFQDEARIKEIMDRLQSASLSDQRDWFVAVSGATMAVIRGPITFQMGADWTDPNRLANDSVDPVTGTVTRTDEERSMRRIIGRDFAIGLKEVSLAEFLQFEQEFHAKINQFMSPTVDYPANKVNWYLAARYCNWLSEKEGLDASEFCFIPDAEGRYGEGLTLAENYLHRRGYRMPTEAEWEYACRAGTTTPQFFGHCSELMPQYVWYVENSREQALIIPGTLKPNALGLFDVFGNVIEWCIDPYAGRPAANPGVVPDLERGLTADAEAWRVLRGGHLYADEPNIRATDLWTFRPLTSDGHYGLRLARTLRSYDGK